MSALPHVALAMLETRFKQLPPTKAALIPAEISRKDVDVTTNTNIQVVK